MAAEAVCMASSNPIFGLCGGNRITGDLAMKKLTTTIVGLLIFTVFLSLEAQAETPNAPVPVNDGQVFHRMNDALFGLLISAPTGMATKPWIGLLAGEAAGFANEARYGNHFNLGHLAVISAGAFAGYGLARWEKHLARKNAEKYRSAR
jgi:hypothetical protein